MAPGTPAPLELTSRQWELNPSTPNDRPPRPSSTQGPGVRGSPPHGPLARSPQQVDVYIMTQPLSGKWIHFGTEVTNSSGRLTFPVPLERALGIGVFPVRMVVR